MKLIDAEELLNREVYYDRAECLVLRYYIEKAPTIDAVPVVRCRECKNHKDTSITAYKHCCLTGQTVRHDDFCSYGERKEGTDNG